MSLQVKNTEGGIPNTIKPASRRLVSSPKNSFPIRRLKRFLRYMARSYRKLKLQQFALKRLFMITWTLFLCGIASYFYLRLHDVDLSQLFGSKKFELPRITFLQSEGFAALAAEILFWASIGVLTRRISTSSKEAQQPNLHVGIYCYEVFTEWITVPIISLIVVLFLSFVHLEIAPGIQLSVTNFPFELVIALGFVLGYFSGDAPATLSYFRILTAIKRSKNDAEVKTENEEL